LEDRVVFSVIVPYRNEASYIGACCEALQRQSIGRDRYELLFVDNRSTDGTSQLIGCAPDVTVIREERPGPYAARNAAIRMARGQFIAFTDADCAPATDWLEQAQQAMHATGAAIAMGRRICPSGSALGVHLLQDYENAKLDHALTRLPSRFAFGWCSNMIIRADVFRRVGLFDEWERAADTAYLQRVIRHDPADRIIFWPALCVTHLEIRTSGQALRRMFVYGASNTRPARQNGYSPLGMGQRWALWRLCSQNPRYRAGDRFLLFCLLAAGGLLYKLGEVKGQWSWRATP
jgi:glycosyltransferase involved in cell wall biosynthesis